MQKPTNITLNDIAKKLGVTKVTVSKALRNHPDISANTKKLVQNTANQLGYVPNFMARNLSSKRSNTIGLVVPKIAHHFFSLAIEEIYESAFENNYEIIMTVSQENVEKEIKHLQTLLSMRVDGLLISVTEKTVEHKIFDAIKKRGVPLIFFDRVVKDIGFSCVTCDDEQGSFDAVAHLVNLGYTKIAHLAGYQHTNIGKNRLNGFKRAVDEYNLNVPDKWIIEGGFDEVAGYKGFNKIMKSQQKPEVIFTVTYPVALGMILAAEGIGLSIPEDVEIISFGGSNYNHYIKPSLTFVEQPVEEISRKAFNLLLDEINNPEKRNQEDIVLPTRIVVCETCKKKESG
jgi:LacI family transcriptional regulator